MNAFTGAPAKSGLLESNASACAKAREPDHTTMPAVAATAPANRQRVLGDAKQKEKAEVETREKAQAVLTTPWPPRCRVLTVVTHVPRVVINARQTPLV